MATPINLAALLREETARRAGLEPRLKSGVHAKVQVPEPPRDAAPSRRSSHLEMHPVLLALEPRRKTARARARTDEEPPREPADDADTIPMPRPAPLARWAAQLDWRHVIGASVAIVAAIALGTFLASW